MEATHTVIGHGFTIQAAQLTGSESIRVDGTVIGNMDLTGALHLSNTGRIEGNILVNSALIAGHVTGSVVCQSTLHMTSSAVVHGDITTAHVIVDEGAILHGMCKTSHGTLQHP